MSMRNLIEDLLQPAGADQTPGARAATACGHAVIGAFIASPFVALGLWVLWGALVWGAVYWLVKEGADLRAGGGRIDGILDAAFVALGAAVLWDWWGFAAVLAAAALDGAYGHRIR